MTNTLTIAQIIWYYDDTLFGKGNYGILISSTEDGTLLLYLSQPGIFPIGLPTHEIKQIRSQKSTLYITYDQYFMDAEDEDGDYCEYPHKYTSCESLLIAIVKFYRENKLCSN